MGSAWARLFASRNTTFTVVLVLFAVQAVFRFESHLSADVAWYLYAGGRLLDGGALYVDVVEVNPPLGVWLTVPIIALARLLGVGVIAALYAVLLGMTALSVALSARFLSAATDISVGARHLLLILLAAMMLFLPAADFGQRDHVAIVLVMPWLLLRWNRFVGRDVSLAPAALVGLMAALGFWLKMHYLIVVLAVEVVLVFGMGGLRSTLRVENLIIIAVGVVYWFAVSLLYSRYLAPLHALSIQVFVPIYGFSFEDIAQALILPTTLAIVAVASAALLSETLLLLRILLVTAGAAFLAIYVVQAGYRHQIIPGLLVMAFAASLGVARVISGDVKPAAWGQGIVALVSVLAVLGVFVIAAVPQSSIYRGGPFEQAIAVEAPQARTIFIASTDVRHPFPLVEEKGLIWASRYPAQWFAPFIARTLGKDGAPGGSISREALEATVSDLLTFAPDIVFIDENPDQPYFSGPPLDYLEFWGQDGRFYSFWKGYEKRGEVDGFGVFVRRSDEEGR
jgi:hypothetical protein